MISRAHRFHGPKGLRYVYQNGKTVRAACFGVKSVLNQRRQAYRLAVVVSRKVEKSAVGRNRMRRRLYAGVRAVAPQITQPYDIVITVFSNELAQLPPQQLQAQLLGLFQAAGIIAKRPVSKK